MNEMRPLALLILTGSYIYPLHLLPLLPTLSGDKTWKAGTAIELTAKRPTRIRDTHRLIGAASIGEGPGIALVIRLATFSLIIHVMNDYHPLHGYGSQTG